MPRDASAKIRLAAAGDLHCREDQHGRFRQLVKQVNAGADLLALCGDLTDRGLEEEARVLAEELSALRVPCVAVLGNHDYDAGAARAVVQHLARAGVHVLDGDHYIFEKELGVAGVKGFGGGFGSFTLQSFGEGQTKAFVQEAVSESLKLEAALCHLDVPRKVVLMHYAPVVDTLEGEAVALQPFLGTSRLAIPVDHYGVQAVFHGHAHHGATQGRTRGGVPVYNVAMPLLVKLDPERRFLVVEL